MYMPEDRRTGGPIPKFTDYHIWKALMSIDNEAPFGRKRLAIILGIGEGSTRTLLSVLGREGLIYIKKTGITLTKKGIEYRDSVFMNISPVIRSDITVNDCNIAVHIPHAAKRVTYGCEERDVAILAGATGATTLVYQSGYLMFPGSNYPLENGDLDTELRQLFRLRNNDVIVIGTASNPELAEIGAVMAALNLTGGLKLGHEQVSQTGKDIADDILSLAFAVHELMGGLPVCAKSRDNLGVRIENGSVIDNAYTGEVLEEAIKDDATIRRIAPSGPYKGIRVVVTPIEMEGVPIASIGVVDIKGIAGSERFLKFRD